MEARSKDYTWMRNTKAANDYLEGQTDCMNGKPRLLGQSSMYYRGYDDEKDYRKKMT